MAETKWYVLRAISGQEKKVKTYMENELARQGVLDSVPQILIPTEKIYEIRKGKKVIREKNLFPGYILVEADLAGEVSHILTSTPGVIGFLQTNNVCGICLQPLNKTFFDSGSNAIYIVGNNAHL